MEPEEYARVAAVEDDHWWYRNTRALVAELLGPWLATGRTILDAGCGPGGNGSWLARYGTVVGVDIADDALRFVRARRPETVPVRADLAALPFGDEAFDAVVGITVLYAVDDDREVLAEVARVLRPGGATVLVEPAFAGLRRAHDVTVHGRRRYRRAPLDNLVRDAGRRVVRSTYAYSFLLPPAAVLAAVARARRRPRAATAPASDVERRALDRVFGPLAEAERRFVRRRTVPFGTSVVVLATRP